MGLDISVYKNLVETTNEDDDVIYTGNNSGFIYQLGNLKQNTYYSVESVDDFCVGSYSSYSEFRRILHSLIDNGKIEDFWNKYSYLVSTDYQVLKREDKLKRILDINYKSVDIPFLEIIDFSDCEGILSCEICGKLYKDFIFYDSKAKNLNDEYFYGLYKRFTNATMIASENNGCICYC